MATQKPGEWANTLIVRFEEQVAYIVHSLSFFNSDILSSYNIINIHKYTLTYNFVYKLCVPANKE